LIDLISLPFRNEGIYRLEDFPEEHQAEIVYLIETFRSNPEIIQQVGEHCRTAERTMVFFKWYGKNFKTRFAVPGLEKDFRQVKTIGISVFNKSSSTGFHFGPLRTTLRVLYNLTANAGDEVYIQVGETINRWDKSPLFVFDDTLLHKSVNESDALRSCLFVDILRPGYASFLLSFFVVVTRFIFGPINFLFYKNWQHLK
jgi:beta-hydroxylase